MLTQVTNFNLIFIVLISGVFVDARYLPTRGNTDNLDRLRELLRDVWNSMCFWILLALS